MQGRAARGRRRTTMRLKTWEFLDARPNLGDDRTGVFRSRPAGRVVAEFVVACESEEEATAIAAYLRGFGPPPENGHVSTAPPPPPKNVDAKPHMLTQGVIDGEFVEEGPRR